MTRGKGVTSSTVGPGPGSSNCALRRHHQCYIEAGYTYAMTLASFLIPRCLSSAPASTNTANTANTVAIASPSYNLHCAARCAALIGVVSAGGVSNMHACMGGGSLQALPLPALQIRAREEGD